MSNFELSTRSLKHLEGVHPDLVRVTKRAIELTKIDFGVTEGVRAYDRQCELYRDKKTTTLESQHLIQTDKTGYGHAIDVAAWVNGKVNWTNRVYGPIVQAFFTAAAEEDVFIVSGHLWSNFRDSVHFELDRERY